MTIAWRVVEVCGVALAVIVGGTTAGYAAAWLLARLGRRYGTDETIDGQIRPPVQIYAEMDDSLRVAAEARRRRAALVTRDATRIVTKDDAGERMRRRVG